MSEKLLKRVLMGVGVLVALYAAVQLLSLVTRPGPASGGQLEREMSRLSPDSIVAISITSPAGLRMNLVARDGVWLINDKRADTAAVGKLRRSLDEMNYASVIAENESSHRRLGVAADSTWLVVFHEAVDSARVMLGSAGVTFGSFYARSPDEAQVYQINGSMRNSVLGRVDDWRDRLIATVDTSSVRQLVVQRGGERLVLTRDGDSWQAATGRGAAAPAPAPTPSAEIINGFLEQLSAVHVSGFAPESTTFTGKEIRSISALGAAGDTLLSLRFAGDTAVVNWLVSSSNSSELYRLGNYQVDRFTRWRSGGQ